MRILIVEDSVTILTLLSAILKKWGHAVETATDGKTAFEKCQSWDPQLIVLDALLPDMHGHAIARRLKSESALWRPIIFLTSCDEDEEISAGIEAGGDDYLVKPVSTIVLKAKIAAMERILRMQDDLVRTRGELAEMVQKLEVVANLDGLTGLPNRRHLEMKLDQEVRRCQRSRAPLSVIMVDVDRFKSFNDGNGHLAGDDGLRQIGNRLSATLKRPADMVARYGGEEFMVVLPETPLGGAAKVADELRTNVEGLQILHPSGGVLTISLGVAMSSRELSSKEALIATADAALYEAKQQGRNRTCVRTRLP